MDEMEALIYDRTQTDVDRVKLLASKIEGKTATGAEISEWYGARMRGAWNHTDLNRIEAWTAALRDELGSHGYTAIIETRSSEWQLGDIPRRSDVDRIRHNVDALQTAFAQLPDWRDIAYDGTIDYPRANALEWDLSRIYVWLQSAVSAYMTRQAGTLFLIAGGVL